MESTDYLRLLRRYMWAPLLFMVVAGLAGAAIYFVGPTAWKSAGQMLVQPGASYRLRWAGARVDLMEEAELWGTLEQLVGSRAVAEQAAQAAGVTTAQVDPLKFERDRRGNMFRLMGSARTPEVATRYVAAAMDVTRDLWDQTRLDRAQAIATEVQQRLTRLEPSRDRLMAEMHRLEAGPPPGQPSEALASLQNQLAEVQGAISAGVVDVGAARDRLAALSGLAGREPATLAQQANPQVATLQTRRSDLQAQRRQMLQTRTENHPEVAALDEELQAVNEDLRRARRESNAGGRASSPLEQQLVLARADAQAAQRRLTELRARQSRLQNQLPDVRARAAAYERITDQLTPLNEERQALMTNLITANNEITRLQASTDLQVVDPAKIYESNRTPERALMLIIGSAFAGLIVGIVLIFILHYIQLTNHNSKEPISSAA